MSASEWSELHRARIRMSGWLQGVERAHGREVAEKAAHAWDRYGWISSDPYRTDAEHEEMLRHMDTLGPLGFDFGLGPVVRDGSLEAL